MRACSSYVGSVRCAASDTLAGGPDASAPRRGPFTRSRIRIFASSARTDRVRGPLKVLSSDNLFFLDITVRLQSRAEGKAEGGHLLSRRADSPPFGTAKGITILREVLCVGGLQLVSYRTCLYGRSSPSNSGCRGSSLQGSAFELFGAPDLQQEPDRVRLRNLRLARFV